MSQTTTDTAPIELSVDVPLPLARAFELFAEQMGSWWPLNVHSLFHENAANVVVETREGGRILESAKDGDCAVWGEILVCEPPRRLVFTWHPNTPEKSEIEITFESLRASETRVTLEHRGWEAFGDRAGEMRKAYETGWPFVFVERFGGAAKEAVA